MNRSSDRDTRPLAPVAGELIPRDDPGKKPADAGGCIDRFRGRHPTHGPRAIRSVEAQIPDVLISLASNSASLAKKGVNLPILAFGFGKMALQAGAGWESPRKRGPFPGVTPASAFGCEAEFCRTRRGYTHTCCSATLGPPPRGLLTKGEKYACRLLIVTDRQAENTEDSTPRCACGPAWAIAASTPIRVGEDSEREMGQISSGKAHSGYREWRKTTAAKHDFFGQSSFQVESAPGQGKSAEQRHGDQEHEPGAGGELQRPSHKHARSIPIGWDHGPGNREFRYWSRRSGIVSRDYR